MKTIARSLIAGAMLAAGHTSRAEDKQPEPPAGVTLTLAVAQAKPDTKVVFRCVLKNTSEKAVEVADSYDGKTACLLGKGDGHRWESRLYPATPKTIGTAKVKAGEERTVFELPADDILFDRITGSAEEAKVAWRWDWTARPKAPPSPFHASDRTYRLLRRADFWAEVEIDGQRTVTKTLPLELRVGVVPVGDKK